MSATRTTAPSAATAAFIGRRVAQALFVVWAAYTVTFFILFALPADPVALIVGSDANSFTPEQLDALRVQHGLDQPLIVQYVARLAGLVTGDLGLSFQSGRPVAGIIGEALGPTLQISALGLTFAIIGGAGVAIAATFTRRRWLAGLLLALPPLGVAVPAFWFGLMLIQWFSFALPIFPAMGDRTPAALVLPAVTLALPTGAMLAQLLSKSLATTLREPYIDTVWAKGAGRVRVHLAHALRNAALPALTMLGLIVGQLLAGAVVTETVFSRPGLGRVAATAVSAQDIPVVLGVVLVAAVAFALANLVVDLVYPLLDPRITVGGAAKRPATSDADAFAAGAPAVAPAPETGATATAAPAPEEARA